MPYLGAICDSAVFSNLCKMCVKLFIQDMKENSDWGVSSEPL